MDDSAIVEVSDLVVRFDAATGDRLDVEKDPLVKRLTHTGHGVAARIIESIPSPGGMLDPEAVDAMLVQANIELQRLHEEFRHGERVLAHLEPLISALRTSSARKVNIVDIGCGTGYLVRWLAARGDLGSAVQVSGYDRNPALVRFASQAAAREGLNCHFGVGDPFAPRGQADIYLSLGLLHHFRGEDLIRFFRSHGRNECKAFLHFDIHNTWLAPLGAWVYHRARMRQPLARHDGVASAVRAHTRQTLLESARLGAPEFDVALLSPPSRLLPMRRIIGPIAGVRPRYDIATIWRRTRKVTRS